MLFFTSTHSHITFEDILHLDVSYYHVFYIFLLTIAYLSHLLDLRISFTGQVAYYVLVVHSVLKDRPCEPQNISPWSVTGQNPLDNPADSYLQDIDSSRTKIPRTKNPRTNTHQIPTSPTDKSTDNLN